MKNVIRSLLEDSKIDINVKMAGDPLLAQAALCDHHSTIEKMLDNKLVYKSIYLIDDSFPPLLGAILAFNSLEVVKAALRHGVQAVTGDKRNFESYLYDISFPIAKFLIEEKIIAKDAQEATTRLNSAKIPRLPLNLEIMQLLVDRKADVNALNHIGQNSLHVTMSHLSNPPNSSASFLEECRNIANQIEFLIEKGADVKAEWRGQTLLRRAQISFISAFHHDKVHPYNSLRNYCEVYPVPGRADAKDGAEVMGERLTRTPLFQTNFSQIIRASLLEETLLLNDLINIVIGYIDIHTWLACISQAAVADRALEIIFRSHRTPEETQILVEDTIAIIDNRPTQEKFRERWRRLTAGEEAPPVSTKPHTYRLWCEARKTAQATSTETPAPHS